MPVAIPPPDPVGATRSITRRLGGILRRNAAAAERRP